MEVEVVKGYLKGLKGVITSVITPKMLYIPVIISPNGEIKHIHKNWLKVYSGDKRQCKKRLCT